MSAPVPELHAPGVPVPEPVRVLLSDGLDGPMCVRGSARARRAARRPPEPSRDNCAVLGMAVIAQALDDLEQGGETARADAAAFLAGGADLEFWCSVASLDIDAIVERARPLQPRAVLR